MVDMHMHTLYSDVDKTVEEVLSKNIWKYKIIL